MEWKTRKESSHGPKKFTVENMKLNTPKVPQQDNFSDCGIYLLQYFESMFKVSLIYYMR